MRIGFIGTGRMGAPMLRRLAGAGHAVTAFDSDPGRLAAAVDAAGATAAGDAAGAVEGAEAVITMLPDDRAVGAVAAAIAPALGPGAALVEMSTGAPTAMEDLRAALPTHAALYDAPVSGGVARARTGELTIMAGGDVEGLARLAPLFAPLGRLARAGELGAGRAVKLLNNYLSAAGLAAACEAVTLGRAFGLDPDLMADIFNGSTGRSNATEVKLKQHVNNGAFATGFTMGLMAKDLTLCRALAAALGHPAPGLAATQTLFARGVAERGAEADHTEIVRLIEQG